MSGNRSENESVGECEHQYAQVSVSVDKQEGEIDSGRYKVERQVWGLYCG